MKIQQSTLFAVATFFLSILLAACAAEPSSVAAQQQVQTPVVAPPLVLDSVLARRLERFDRYFSENQGLQGAPGAAVVVVKDSNIVFCKGYGLRAAGSRDSVDIHTVFRIGSLSKGFAGVLTGILVQDSLFNWADPVVLHYPDFALRDHKQAERVNLMHLLSHTSGLPYHAYTNLVEAGYTIPQIVAQFPKVKLFGKEGETYCYQNAAFSVVGEVMYAKTGKTYETLLREKIFQPAGMRYASASYNELMACPDKALPHNQSACCGWVCTPISEAYYNAAPAGGVNASIYDMGQWLKVLLGFRPDIVAPATLDTVFAPRVRTERERHIFGHWARQKESWYGLGWRILRLDDRELVYHGGLVNSYRGEIAVDRKSGIAICILFNGPTSLASDCVPTFFDLFEKD